MNGSTAIGICGSPFLAERDYPQHGGVTDIAGRFCADIGHSGAKVSCCLPCPTAHWVYSDGFESKTRIANYISIVSFILNTFLLLTFIFVPREKSHRHYLSIGLTTSLILIALAFVIPLGTKPDFCHNDITPNSLHSDASCAVTGIFVEAGAMGAVVWILLRSVWTALRIMIDFQRTELFRRISIGLGVGLPILYLVISLPVTGVSYRLNNVCIPSHPSALATWFAWILIFGTVSVIIQIIVLLFCLWRFARSSLAGPVRGTSSDGSINAVFSPSSDPQSPQKVAPTPRRKKRIAWRKVRGLLALQWRSIVLAFIVANLTIFFGIVFIQQTATTHSLVAKGITPSDLAWIACLMANNGKKDECLHGPNGLGLSESRAAGTLILASLIGIIVFLLMVRTSMFIGWWELLQHPRSLLRRPSTNSDEFVMFGQKSPVPSKPTMEQIEDLRARSIPNPV